MRLILTLLTLMFCNAAWSAPTCEITALNLIFGVYDPLDISPLENDSAIVVECHENALLGSGAYEKFFNITMTTGSSGSYFPRRMSSGSDNINYNLYTDSARSLVWGDGTSGSNRRFSSINIPGCSILSLILTCPSGFKFESVYGQIPAQQAVDVGTYSDMITATIHF